MDTEKVDSRNISIKRQILMSTRMRFAPEVQSVRNEAIDKTVEQNLLIADLDIGLSISEIEEQEVLHFTGGAPAITRGEIELSLKRLIKLGKVVDSLSGAETVFQLSDASRKDLTRLEEESRRRISAIALKLFIGIGKQLTEYERAMLSCLCVVFAQLGEVYVKQLVTDSKSAYLGLPNLEDSILETLEKFPSLDAKTFNRGILQFFEQDDPEYISLKWNLAQNFYIAKMLGFDKSGYKLSRELFDGSNFYLDTNVIIHALEPSATHHSSFRALNKAIDTLSCKLSVCQITLDELRLAVEYGRQNVEQLGDDIPEGSTQKVRGVFFRLFKSSGKAVCDTDFEKLFERFYRANEILQDEYSVSLVDDQWFDDSDANQEIEDLARILRAESQHRGRRKSKGASFHDAKILHWARKESDSGSKATWVVTLDRLLPVVKLNSGGDSQGSPAITLDALIQWMAPLAVGHDDEAQFQEIFSEAVRYQLLPQETFFDIQDFRVFKELSYSCKDLPADDVEQCIAYLKSEGRMLDPTNPEEREIMANKLARFFSDPTRTYKSEIEKLENDVSTVNNARIADEAIHRQEQKCLLDRLGKIEQKAKESEEDLEVARVKTSAILRFIFACIPVFVVLEAAAIVLTYKFGSGDNVFQRVGNLWYLPTVAFAVWVILASWILGKKRIGSMNGVMRKVLGE